MSSSASKKIIRPRVWRACEVCRKRKIRCDGKDPCSFCTLNSKTCLFTQAQDHASLSRQTETDTRERLERLESRLDKLIPLIETTHSWITRAQNASASDPLTDPFATAQPAISSSKLNLQESSSPIDQNDDLEHILDDADPSTHTEVDLTPTAPIESALPEPSSEQDLPENSVSGREDIPAKSPAAATSWAERLAGQFARDSIGNMRYLGGAPTFVLAEAVDSVRKAQPSDQQSPTSGHKRPTVDHLYFRPNVFYRPLSGLPEAETIQYPPMIVSDALVQMYFSKIHHTFPIIDAPHFMRRYKETMDGLRRDCPSPDYHFLCVLFAVYASAASLTKKVFQDRAEFEYSDPKEYIGLEFYEKALYMYWRGFRTSSMENVTCMALLSSCLAGWNTLAQAWVLAGQAVRNAQDLGLHRSPQKASVSTAVKEYRRKVWWCIYGLDKILSVSLGRPSAIDDEDCDVEFPSDEVCCVKADPRVEAPGNNPLTGFKSLLKIYIIAGKIEKVAHNINFLKKYDNAADHPVVRSTIDKLDLMLDEWSDSLPDSIRFAANNPGRPDMFAMCLLGHFTLYACVLNLHRPFMPDLNTSDPALTFKSLQKCVNAAQGCIRVGDEIKKLLPTSHHCQFCVQYLTISGVTLLRCLPYVANPTQLVKDAAQCRLLLAQLEDTWPGSKQCGALIQDLLNTYESFRSRRPSVNVEKRLHSSTNLGENVALASGTSKRFTTLQAVSNRHDPDNIDGTMSQSIPSVNHTPQPGDIGLLTINALPGPLPTTDSVFTPNTQASLSTAIFEETQEKNESQFLWEDFTDAAFFGAPFDLGDEIGALLGQMQNSASGNGEAL